MRIGILKVTKPEKGLGKCADTLAWAFRRHTVSVFPVSRLLDLYRGPSDPFLAWAHSLDVFCLIEQFLPRVAERLQSQGVRVVFVPNPDWAVLFGDEDVSRWVDAVRGTGVDVWARTPCTRDALARAGLASRVVGWSTADPVRRRRPRSADPAGRREIVFLMNAGRGGWRRRRGVDIALRAFAIVRSRRPRTRLIVTAMRPLAEMAGDVAVDPAVTVIQGWQTAEAMRRLRREAAAVVHPSRWEGLGYPMLEALFDGLPVIATDGWPMNEFVTHERTGLLVPARRAGDVRLAAHWECEPEAVAAAMQRLVDDRELCARLTCATPDAWRASQRAFPRRASTMLRLLRRPAGASAGHDHGRFDVEEHAGLPVGARHDF